MTPNDDPFTPAVEMDIQGNRGSFDAIVPGGPYTITVRDTHGNEWSEITSEGSMYIAFEADEGKSTCVRSKSTLPFLMMLKHSINDSLKENSLEAIERMMGFIDDDE
jgi:hypothetical protein|tara:strand:+ start:614 stop:934 length:321 start_codon:yes stop_codon:yes gene_type:complete